jgi:CO/xanthine dehydrogenase Mo-binding subunit
MTAADMPDIDIHLIETDDPEGPFGAKGIGEAGAICAPAAIANAVADAIGVRVTDLPITPEKVLRALKERERRKTE